MCRLIVSMICVPIVSVGFSEVIGSWKIIPISRAAHVLELPLGELRQVAPVEHDRRR